MLLSDLFDQLSYGELTQLEMGGADEEGVLNKNYRRIVPHINLALTELHKRFPLRQEEVTIDCFDHIETYQLHSRYAKTNTASTEPYKYIDDSIYEPFQDNVLKIEKVFNEDGQELYLNETNSYIIRTQLQEITQKAWSVSVPNFNTIQVPYSMKENALIVEYRADHERILIPDLKPAETEIKIPSYLLEPLLLYIAGRVATNLGGDSTQDGMAYIARFEAACNKADHLGLTHSDNTSNQRLDINGWV